MFTRVKFLFYFSISTFCFFLPHLFHKSLTVGLFERNFSRKSLDSAIQTLVQILEIFDALTWESVSFDDFLRKLHSPERVQGEHVPRGDHFAFRIQEQTVWTHGSNQRPNVTFVMLACHVFLRNLLNANERICKGTQVNFEVNQILLWSYSACFANVHSLIYKYKNYITTCGSKTLLNNQPIWGPK